MIVGWGTGEPNLYSLFALAHPLSKIFLWTSYPNCQK